MTMHQGLVEQAEKFRKRVASNDTSDYKVVLRNQLVVGFPIDEGVLSFQRLYDAAIVSPAYDIWDLQDAALVFPLYLERFLRSADTLRFFRAKLHSTTARRRTLPDDIFLGLPVPVPPLPEQRRIAAILDKADDLRAKRRAALAELDGLAQSVFVEMFGDPVTNPKRWQRSRIGDLATVVTGNTPSRDKLEYYYGDGIEWIKSDNINTSDAMLTVATERLSDAGRAVARTAPAGSILVTCIAGSPSCIGNAAIADREVAFNQQINALTPHTCDVFFLYWQLVLAKTLVQLASTGGMKGLVSKSRFEAVELVVPPLSDQKQFGRFACRLRALQNTQQESFATLDTAFVSLQDRAFRGEL